MWKPGHPGGKPHWNGEERLDSFNPQKIYFCGNVILIITHCYWYWFLFLCLLLFTNVYNVETGKPGGKPHWKGSWEKGFDFDEPPHPPQNFKTTGSLSHPSFIAVVEVSGRCQALPHGDENHLARWSSSPDLKRLQILDLVSSSVFFVAHKSSIGKCSHRKNSLFPKPKQSNFSVFKKHLLPRLLTIVFTAFWQQDAQNALDKSLVFPLSRPKVLTSINFPKDSESC